MPGFPIRTPWDHSLVDSSPRPIAASHVLHRLLVPRHPPSALDNLTTKMLASTVQFSNNKQTRNPTTTHQTNPPQTVTVPSHCISRLAVWMVRHGLPEKTRPTRPPNPPPPSRSSRSRKPLRCLFLQDPTGCRLKNPPAAPTTPIHTHPPRKACR